MSGERSIKALKLFLGGIALFLISCENDPEQVSNLTSLEKGPLESAKEVEVLYSETAKLRVFLKSSQLDKYAGDDPYIEFPKGLKVFFYGADMKVENQLKANYAIRYERKAVMEAKGDVEVVNEKGEKLNTEKLIWDEKKEMIYTDAFVKVTTLDEVILGEGLEANQTFTKYKVKKIKGTINLKQD